MEYARFKFIYFSLIIIILVNVQTNNTDINNENKKQIELEESINSLNSSDSTQSQEISEEYVNQAKLLFEKLAISKDKPTSREVLGVFLKGMIMRMKEVNEVEMTFYNMVIDKALTKIPEIVQGNEIVKYTSAEFLESNLNEVIRELGYEDFGNDDEENLENILNEDHSAKLKEDLKISEYF